MNASTPVAAALSACLIAWSHPAGAEPAQQSPAYDSAFSSYEPYRDAELAPWPQLNEQVSRAARSTSTQDRDAGPAEHADHEHAHHGGDE